MIGVTSSLAIKNAISEAIEKGREVLRPFLPKGNRIHKQKRSQ